MTFTEGVHMHQQRGHYEFKKAAELKDKWPIFIRTVCRHVGCSEEADIK